MSGNKFKEIKLNKKSRNMGIGVTAILVSACDPGNLHYCPSGFCYIPDEPDIIVINEYTFGNTSPSAFAQISPSVFVALDNTDHVLDMESSFRALEVTAKAGDDIIDTGSGDDVIYGGSGYDIIRSHYGMDVVYGGDGFDHISGGAGDDDLFGDGGDDWLFGGEGADIVSGGFDDDRIWGGSGVDFLYGESGDDTFEIYEEEYSHLEDYFDGGSGTDKLKFYVEDPTIQMDLDLSLVDAANIEVIDLNDIDDEIALVLTVQDVIYVTDSDNELFIKGDSRDDVVSVGEGWTQGADEGNYHVYTFADATLLIDMDIPQTIS